MYTLSSSSLVNVPCVYVISVVAILVYFHSQDVSGQAVYPVCREPRGNCACMTDKGLVDLSPLDSTVQNEPNFNGIKDPNSNFMYYYNPCTPFSKPNSIACTNAAVCQGLPYPNPTSFWQYGLHTGAVFANNDTTHKLEIQYSGAARSIITLECDASQNGVLTFNMEYPINLARLTLASKYACPAGGGGMTVGTILCILFIVLVLLYLIVGTLYMHFVRGAVGVEKIPNSSFWIQFPGLVKDGVAFVVNPVRSAIFGYNQV